MKRTNRFARVLQLSIAAVVAVLASRADADVTLPAIFSDHMVLQRDAAVPVWGWAEPGEQVTVSIAGQARTAKADAKGRWMVKLAKLKAGEALAMTVKGKNSIAISDVLVGEVWLCSGQSNMAMTVNRAKDFDKEQAAASLPKVRHFRESSAPSDKPQEKGVGKWEVCSAETVGGFSATAYFFGREVHKALGVPVGVINSSVGGTPVEAWTSWEAQKNFAELKSLFESWEQRQATWDPVKAQAAYEKQLVAFKEAAKKAKTEGTSLKRPPRKPEEPRIATHHPATLFNGKIAPLVPYALRGAIWYQGESNAGQGHLYHLQLSALVNDWRARWGLGDFPFAWVQLPNFHAAQKEPVEDTGWVLVREGMLKTLALPNTGMAITTDIGETSDIHPKDKQTVGKRLAMWALAKVYGQKVAASGPLPVSHKINGSEVTVTFKHADSGLVVNAGGAMVTPREEWPSVWPEGGFGQIRGFVVAGADKKWHRAAAKIIGNTVVVKSPEVKQPVAVRYAWADNPDCNLYNRAGLPASPFRTDDWKIAPPQPLQPKARR
ncbi:MAG: sialate O-acetylesterase [Verrucomicrobia bacterium]|nr:sialate O-acetylesterase [Verrucomicrobiota bacterium]